MFIRKFEPQLYAILRIVAGLLFLWHGTQKYFDFPPSGHVIPLYIILIAGSVELGCGTLMMVGLLTRWAAFLASGEMAYAYWVVHAKGGLLPLVNHGELAIVYCFLFLYICSRGAGIWSVDSLLKKT